MHWKTRIAVTVAGVTVLGATGVGMGKAIAAIRRQAGKLAWTERGTEI